MSPTQIRGTVTLVALCFVTVLGITLAGYLAVCSRTMTLSNRSYQDRTSLQLAELGVDEALRAFNKNNWSGWSSNPSNVSGATTAWTLDTTNHRASRTITFNSPKLGQGVTGTIKIRVDNYDANELNATWNSSTNYNIGDLVGRSGIWYRSVQNDNSGHTPSATNLTWWVPVPIPCSWSSNTLYTNNYDIISEQGGWYVCAVTHTSGTSFDSSKWTAIPAPKSWTALTSYDVDDIVYSSNTWYRCISAHTSGFSITTSKFTTASWSYQSSVTYSFNSLVCYSGTWYRCIVASSNNVSPASTTPLNWENASTGAMYGWSSTINYNPGDTIYHSGTSDWYRCIRANSAQTPSGTSSYWANTPLYSIAWDSNREYSQNDTARYKGVWYRYINTTASSGNLPTNTTYWIGANTSTASAQWNATTAYAVGDYRCYDGAWYKCIAATTAGAGHSPNNTTYWTPTWANGWGVTTGAPVVYAEGTIAIAGNRPVTTQLRAIIAPTPLFPNAAGATTDLTITTGTGTVDSYDSSVAAYSAGTAGYSAVLAAGSTLAITGSTAVKGYLAWPSPPAGISTGTTVKSSTSAASPNVDTSRVSRSPYVPQLETVPSGDLATGWATTPKGIALPTTGSAITVNIGTPGSTAPTKYYSAGDLELGAVTSIQTLNINGPVILYIDGDLRFRGSGSLNINSAGSAEIHFSDQLIFEFGNSGINNRAPSSTNPDPKKLILIGHGSNGNAQLYRYATSLYGTIYLPNTTNTSGLAIDTGVQLYGALSAKEITFNSEANVHYDTSLRYATFGGVDQPYTVSEWRELDVTEQATMP